MIRKLKTKLILLCMASLFALLAVIVAGMNLLNYRAVVDEADSILSLLSQNKGEFPELGGMRDDRFPPDMSPELPYESRYFSVLLTDSGEVIHTETSRIASVDPATAIRYAEQVFSGNEHRGFADRFRFVRQNEANAVRITFLDCGRMMDSFYTFLFASLVMAAIGLVIVFFPVLFFAERIVRPIAESDRKQKQFITDAGHEMKTPLTIIHANADILEMELGKNEWLDDIQLQTKRLTSLTNDLVCLTRMEEAERSLPMIAFPISEIVQDAAAPFRTLAQTQGKELICNIQPMLSMTGDAKTIEQLVSILIDNALKYSPAGGVIALELTRQSKTLSLSVCNTIEVSLGKEQLRHLFDRFYRADPSRNSETGGHGIGLSVAKAIVTAHNGRIQAEMQDAHTFRITAVFPI